MKTTATMCLKDKKSLKALYRISSTLNWEDASFTSIVEAFRIMFPKIVNNLKSLGVEINVKEVLEYVDNMDSTTMTVFLTSEREDGVVDISNTEVYEDILKGEVSYLLSLGYSLTEAMREWDL